MAETDKRSMSPLIGEEGLGVDYMSENGSFNLRIRDTVIISSMSAYPQSRDAIASKKRLFFRS